MPNVTTRAAVRLSHCCHPVVVAIHEGDSIRRQVGHHLGLRALHALDATELTGMRQTHLEHDADIGSDDRHEVSDLADPSGAHLDDEVLGALVDPQHRDRRADLVVERTFGRDRRPFGAQNRAQQVLGGRLAVRPRDRHDPKASEAANPRHDNASESGKGGNAVGNHDQRAIDVEFTLGDDDGRARFDGGRREQRTIRRLTGEREEHRPGPNQPRVGFDAAVDDRVGDASHDMSTERVCELGEGEGDHQPASRRAARASSRAEYGVRTPSMSR